MIDPQAIATFRSAAGLGDAPPAAAPAAPMAGGTDIISQRKQALGLGVPAPAPTAAPAADPNAVNPAADFAKIGKAALNFGKNTVESVVSHATDAANYATEQGKQSVAFNKTDAPVAQKVAQTVAGAGQSIFHGVGQGGAAIGDIFANTVKGIWESLPDKDQQKLEDVWNNSNVKRDFSSINLSPQAKQALEHIHDAAQKNPEIADSLNSGLNSLNFLLPEQAISGAEGLVNGIPKVAETLSSAATDIKGAIKPGIGAVKDLVSGGADYELAAKANPMGGAAEAPKPGAAPVEGAAAPAAEGVKPVEPIKPSSQPMDAKTTKAFNDEKGAWNKPSQLPKGFGSAGDIARTSAEKGNDVGEVLTKNGIRVADNVENVNGKRVFDTQDSANSFRKDTVKASNEMLRPALQKADAEGAARTSVSELFDAARANIESDKSLTDDMKEVLSKKLDASEAVKTQKNHDGLSLENLHDEKIVRDSNAKYNQFGDTASGNEARMNKAIADAARTTLEAKAPADIPVKEINAEFAKRFQAADYLEALHGKNVPATMGNIIARTGAKVGLGAVGGVLGAAGGGIGSIGGEVAGYKLGGLVESYLEGIPDSMRASALRSLAKENPKAFEAVSDFLKKSATPAGEDSASFLAPKAELPVEKEMGTYKLDKKPNTGVVDLNGQYRKPGINFYPPKPVEPTEMGTYKLNPKDGAQYRKPGANFYPPKK